MICIINYVRKKRCKGMKLVCAAVDNNVFVEFFVFIVFIYLMGLLIYLCIIINLCCLFKVVRFTLQPFRYCDVLSLSCNRSN